MKVPISKTREWSFPHGISCCAAGFQHPADALFAVYEAYLDAKLLVEVGSEVLGTIYRTVLPAGAAEGEHEVGEAPFDVPPAMGIGKMIDGIEESKDFTVVLKELDYSFVHSRQLFVGLVTSGIMGRTAVKHIASAITALVGGNAFFITEAEDAHHQRPLSGRLCSDLVGTALGGMAQDIG